MAKSNMQAVQVRRMQDLLTKDFSEHRNGYEIQSRVSPHQQRRLQKLTMDII